MYESPRMARNMLIRMNATNSVNPMKRIGVSTLRKNAKPTPQSLPVWPETAKNGILVSLDSDD